MADAEAEAHLGDTAAAPAEAAAAPAEAAPDVAAAPAAPAPQADTPAGIWRALGIQDEHTEMGILSRQQALITENAITCIGRNLQGMKKEATKTKSDLTQTKQIVSVHTVDIAELKGKADDDSALKELMAEIAAIKKQTFEVRAHTRGLQVTLRLSSAAVLFRRCAPRATQPLRSHQVRGCRSTAAAVSARVTTGQPPAADAADHDAQRPREGPRGARKTLGASGAMQYAGLSGPAPGGEVTIFSHFSQILTQGIVPSSDFALLPLVPLSFAPGVSNDSYFRERAPLYRHLRPCRQWQQHHNKSSDL